MKQIIRRDINFIMIILVAVGLLIFFHTTGILSPIENIVLKTFSPIQSATTTAAVRISNFFQRFGKIGAYERENEKLVKEMESLLVENGQLKIKIKEFNILSQEFKFLEEHKYNSVSSRVISASPDPNIQSLSIDKGTNSGIKTGQAVIVGDGVLVGKITEVNNDTSKVLLITDSQSKISGMIENDNSSQGVVSGEHGISLKMELIPQDDLVNPGQYVVTSGFEEGIPKGLLVGQIDKVIKNPGELFQSVTIRSPESLKNLLILSVII